MNYEIDNSSILYLALVRKDHTNIYRFTMTLNHPVDPVHLQQAVDQIYRRFPTIFAGFRKEGCGFVQVPASQPPRVQQDPGMLRTLTRQEVNECAMRIYYAENDVMLEAFHALTDGYGAMACFSTLIARYLWLHLGVHIPVSPPLMDPEEAPKQEELEDAYLQNTRHTPARLPGRYAYQMPGGDDDRSLVTVTDLTFPAANCLAAAKKYGTSITGLVSGALAMTILEHQEKYPTGRKKPVRIMVPLDLRKHFPSKTLRNFILYVLPTLEPEEISLSSRELFACFDRQLRQQLDPMRLGGIISYNVKTQTSLLYRCIPAGLKTAAMRLAYRYFGESNSSITLTNLGNVKLPAEMTPYVTDIQVALTPRARSPYNATILSYGGRLHVTVSRFTKDTELEETLKRKLSDLIYQEEP